MNGLKKYPTEEELDIIKIELEEREATIGGTAKLLGHTHAIIKRWAQDYGIRFKRVKPRYSNEQICAIFDRTGNVLETSDETGYSFDHIRTILKKNNYPKNRNGAYTRKERTTLDPFEPTVTSYISIAKPRSLDLSRIERRLHNPNITGACYR